MTRALSFGLGRRTAPALSSLSFGVVSRRARPLRAFWSGLAAALALSATAGLVEAQSANLPPVADAGGDVTAALGAVVKLDGSGSSDPDGDALSYVWAQTGDPGVALADAGTATPSFEAPGAPGPLAFRLTVSDPGGLTDSDTVTVTVAANPVHRVPLLPPASHPDRQGLVRVINRSAQAGEVSIVAFDDAGADYGPLTLRIGANAAAHFTSHDLERGDVERGLSGVGEGEGDWRLELISTLDLEVLSYVRVRGGALASLHDVVPADEAGESAVVLMLAPGTSRALNAQALESGEGEGLSGALGAGAGKWLLRVFADRPVQAMSLMSHPGGHVANVSSIPDDGGVRGQSGVPVFATAHEQSGAEDMTAVVTLAASAANGDPVTFTITGGADEARFTLSGARLAFRVPPDYEAPADADGDNVYEVTARASGEGGDADSLALRVTVTDVVNDTPPPANRAPAFTTAAAQSVAENTTAVVTLAASDADDDPVTFTITGGADSTHFALSGASLAFRAVPDYEAPVDADGDNVYEVTVEASDERGGTASLTLRVTVTDVTDLATGALRLVGGTSALEGRVEVYSSGQWGTVCDDYWGDTDATVACRQLGYHSGTAHKRAHFGQGSGPIWLDNVACTGDESRLIDCPYNPTPNCHHGEDAGVTCTASSEQ